MLDTFRSIGLPKFSQNVVRIPKQWKFFSRQKRRLVIKEVNPQACRFFLVNYRPKVVFLVRHPIAIGLSYQKMGWLPPNENFWKDIANKQGMALKHAWDALQSYPEHIVVCYEELCLDPLKEYRRIFDFAGLAWDERIESLIKLHSSKGNFNDPYDTHRNSQKMAQIWREKVSDREIEDTKSIYNQYGSSPVTKKQESPSIEAFSRFQSKVTNSQYDDIHSQNQGS